MFYDHQLLLSLQQKEIERKARHAWKWYQKGSISEDNLVSTKSNKVIETQCQPVHMTCCTNS